MPATPLPGQGRLLRKPLSRWQKKRTTGSSAKFPAPSLLKAPTYPGCRALDNLIPGSVARVTAGPYNIPCACGVRDIVPMQHLASYGIALNRAFITVLSVISGERLSDNLIGRRRQHGALAPGNLQAPPDFIPMCRGWHGGRAPPLSSASSPKKDPRKGVFPCPSPPSPNEGSPTIGEASFSVSGAIWIFRTCSWLPGRTIDRTRCSSARYRASPTYPGS